MKYTLIVGDAATYEEDGETHADFQRIDYIKTFLTFEEAEAQGEQAISRGRHNSYVIAQNFYGTVTYTPNKKGESKCQDQ
jgi:hypothetical protein